MANLKAKFEVTLQDPRFGKRELADYIRNAVQWWCKQYDPESIEFYIGENATVKPIKDKE